MITPAQHVYLSRRNLLTLLSKLDRAAEEQTLCTIIKYDKHEKYPQSCPMMVVTAVEDEEYYSTRDPGEVHPLDTPK